MSRLELRTRERTNHDQENRLRAGVSSFTVAVWAADAFTGTWKMDVAKSTFAKGREVKELTSVVVEQGDSASVTVKGTAGDGKPIAVKYTVALKGGPINYTEGGPPAGVSVMGKRVNLMTIDSTSMMNGKEIGSTQRPGNEQLLSA